MEQVGARTIPNRDGIDGWTQAIWIDSGVVKRRSVVELMDGGWYYNNNTR